MTDPIPDPKALSERMLLDGMYPGIVEKWAKEAAVLEAQLAAALREKEALAKAAARVIKRSLCVMDGRVDCTSYLLARDAIEVFGELSTDIKEQISDQGAALAAARREENDG